MAFKNRKGPIQPCERVKRDFTKYVPQSADETQRRNAGKGKPEGHEAGGDDDDVEDVPGVLIEGRRLNGRIQLQQFYLTSLSPLQVFPFNLITKREEKFKYGSKLTPFLIFEVRVVQIKDMETFERTLSRCDQTIGVHGARESLGFSERAGI